MVLKIEELNKFLKDYEDAANSHDFEKVRPLIDEEATYEFTDGSFKGIKEIEQAFKKTFNKIKKEVYKISDIIWLFIDEKSAVCQYGFHWKGIVDGIKKEGKGRGTNLIVEKQGEFKILHEHLSK